MRTILYLSCVITAFSVHSVDAQIHSGGRGDGYAIQEIPVHLTNRNEVLTDKDTFIVKDSTFDSQSPLYFYVPNGYNWMLFDLNGRAIDQGSGNVIIAGNTLTRGTYLIRFIKKDFNQTASWYFY